MKEEHDVSIAARPQEESKIKKYLRNIAIVIFVIFFVALIVGAIVRKFGG